MIELIYGARNFDRIAWKEIDEGRPVAIRVAGIRKPFVYRALAMYAEYDREFRAGRNRRDLLFSFSWRAMFVPSLFGIVNHARLSGMALTMKDRGSTLEIRFERESV